MHTTDTDLELYDVVLLELSQDPEFYPWQRCQAPGGLGPRVLTQTAQVCEDILEWTLDPSDQSDLYDGSSAISDMLTRNRVPSPLEHYQPKHGANPVSRNQLCGHFSNRSSNGVTNDRCILRFAAPGYGPWNRTACVFFWFEDGGENGGGTGLFRFNRCADSWELRSKRIAYHGARQIADTTDSASMLAS